MRHVDYRQQSVAGDDDPRYGINRFILSRGTNSGSAGSDAGSPDKRGKVVGTIMSGLLLGILLARTVAGLLANLGGWRTVFWVASVLMALMALALWRGLPQMKSETHLDYPQVVGFRFQYLLSAIKFSRTRALLGCLTCQFQHSLDLNGLFACRSTF